MGSSKLGPPHRPDGETSMTNPFSTPATAPGSVAPARGSRQRLQSAAYRSGVAPRLGTRRRALALAARPLNGALTSAVALLALSLSATAREVPLRSTAAILPVSGTAAPASKPRPIVRKRLANAIPAPRFAVDPGPQKFWFYRPLEASAVHWPVLFLGVAY